MTDRRIVLGIDGGGTTTRAVAVDLTGRTLAWVQAGSASPGKTPHARENVRQAIQEVAAQAGRTLSEVAALVAGIAEIDGPEDKIWAAEFTTLPGLTCPRIHVNDAVVAHAGALESRPGIIAIAGTGSIVYGVTEAGRQIRNYDFHHAPAAQARSLSYDAVHALLAGEAGAADADLVAAILDFWQMGSMEELREMGRRGFIADRFERGRRFGEMAPLVTAAAQQGSPLASRVCDQVAAALGTSIRLVGGCFALDSVPVALIGGVIRSPYMQGAMARSLGGVRGGRYDITEPAFSGEVGAARMALQVLWAGD